MHNLDVEKETSEFSKFSQEIFFPQRNYPLRAGRWICWIENGKNISLSPLYPKNFLFEIHANPVAVRFFDETVHHLGVKQYIPNPLEDKELNQCMSEKSLKELVSLINKATKEEPIINYETDVVMDGSTHRCKIKIMKQYSLEDEEYVYSGAVGKLEDITSDYRQRAELERAATHDPLTNLLNKAHSRKLIEYYLKNHPKVNYALAFIDLDNFKKINDTYGHQKGDQVILAVTDAMRQNCPAGGLCARVGGRRIYSFWKDVGKTVANAKKNV